MKYIDTWLTGLGLEYVIPKLKTNGITTPKKLASLSLREIYEVVGVEDSEDRKKLFFLIQRLQTILHHKNEEESNKTPLPTSDREVVLEKALCLSSGSSLSPKCRSELIFYLEEPKQTKDLEDLRLLRIHRRQSEIPIVTPHEVPAESRERKVLAVSSKANHQQHVTDLSFEKESILTNDLPIRVVVRKRPLGKNEMSRGERDVLEIKPTGMVLVHEPKTKVDLTRIVETQTFLFDDSFDAEEANDGIYQRTVKPLISFIFDGGKATCFAYGQTGSGKTFTMMGSNPSNPAEATSNAGLYVLAAHDIFSTIKRNKKYQKMKVMVSCFEIYGGKLFDLLNSRSVVKCLEDSKQRVQVVGLTEHSIHDVNDLLSVMSSAHSQRSTGSTGANAESSRSHQIMQIVLKNSSDDKLERKLSFIDLAGSERGADTNHSSKQTRLEGAEINTSLLALKEVIRSLERKNGFTPFRGSKLTQVLKDSFVGERTRTCMIACVSPSHVNCEHTLNTLRYADRVKEHQASENRSSATAQCEPTLSEELEEHPRRQSISLKQKMGESEQQNRKSRENKLPIADSQIRPKSVPVLKRNTSGLNQEKNVDLIRKTVNLLSAHKLAIAEMVEVMKDEMELVQEMENVDERNTDMYVDKLDLLITAKAKAITTLQDELRAFQNFRISK